MKKDTSEKKLFNIFNLIGHMKIERIWAMPNSRTFKIKPISEKRLIKRFEKKLPYLLKVWLGL